MIKPSVSYHIDLTGSCNLKCPSCSMGRGEEYPAHTMKPGELRAILNKATKESYPLGVWLYNYTEPFLSPHLPEMVRVVKEFGLPAYISSNFNVSKNMVEVLAEQPDTLIASMSGFTQEVYSKTHTAGDIDKVKANMMLASRVRSNTTLRVHWHRYKHNEHEQPLMEAYVKSLPRKWNFHSYRAVRIDLEQVLQRFEGGVRSPLEDNLTRDLDEARELCLGRTHYSCYLQTGTVSINSQGFYRLCSAVYDSHQQTHFLNGSVVDFMKMREKHDYCSRCIKNGGHVYAMELTDQPVHSIHVKAEELYRKIPFRGVASKLIAKARAFNLHAKPD